jgi:hypothetical protein
MMEPLFVVSIEINIPVMRYMAFQIRVSGKVVPLAADKDP